MDFICPVCMKKLPRELERIIPHTEEHIIDEIKKLHPKWAEKNGVCNKCFEYYKREIHGK